jgi:hypothetical protein
MLVGFFCILLKYTFCDCVLNADSEINDCIYDSNNYTDIPSFSGNNITVLNSKFTNINAEGNSLFSIDNDQNFTFSNCSFESITSRGNGAVCRSTGNCYFISCIFDSCSSTYTGSGWNQVNGSGSVYYYNGTSGIKVLYIERCTFSKCSANGYGGCIAHADANDVIWNLAIYCSTFSENTGSRGGFLFNILF